MECEQSKLKSQRLWAVSRVCGEARWEEKESEPAVPTGLTELGTTGSLWGAGALVLSPQQPKGTHLTPQRSPKREPFWTRTGQMWSSGLSYLEGELGFLRKLSSQIKSKLDPGGQDIRISFCSAFCNIYSSQQQ